MNKTLLTILLTLGVWSAPLAAQNAMVSDGQDKLVVFTSPLIKKASGARRDIGYSTSTKSGQLTTVTDRYALAVLAPSGKTVIVGFRVTMTSNDKTPFAEKAESQVIANLAKKAKERSKCQGCLHADVVSIDGEWFEAHGFDTVGTRSPATVAIYFGHRNGKSYTLDANFIVEEIPMETVRSIVESVRLPEASAKYNTNVYEPFSHPELTAQGFRGNFGPLIRRHSKAYALKDMNALPTPSVDGTSKALTAGYYSFEFVDKRDEKWLWMMCMPTGASGDRDAMEQAVLSGNVVSSVKLVGTVQGSHGGIRRFAYQRRSLFGGAVAESSWSVFRDGVLYQIGTEGGIDNKEVEVLIAGLDAPGLRCEPLDAVVRPTGSPSTGLPSESSLLAVRGR